MQHRRGCSLPSGCVRVYVSGWGANYQNPTNESTQVGWVFNELNMEHLTRIFLQLAPCSDLKILVGHSLETNAGLNSKQL